MSSQTGFSIIIATEKTEEDRDFLILGNIIYYTSTQSKRDTCSILASEICGMVEILDMAYTCND